jgi:hypothetical protein
MVTAISILPASATSTHQRGAAGTCVQHRASQQYHATGNGVQSRASQQYRATGNGAQSRASQCRTTGTVQSRASQRGAAVFVVVMVLTSLTALGVFAVRASSMAGRAAGYERQNTQNHYVGEYGLLSAVTELSSSRRSAYVQKMTSASNSETCSANKGRKGAPCYPIYANDVQKSVSSNFGNRPLFEQATPATTPPVPGSLGPAGLDGDFVVELTDPGPVSLPVAGSDVGGTGTKFKYLQLTLTSVGQVRPAGDPTACAPSVTAVAGNETGRAFVVIGPLP